MLIRRVALRRRTLPISPLLFRTNAFMTALCVRVGGGPSSSSTSTVYTVQTLSPLISPVLQKDVLTVAVLHVMKKVYRKTSRGRGAVKAYYSEGKVSVLQVSGGDCAQENAIRLDCTRLYLHCTGTAVVPIS